MAVVEQIDPVAELRFGVEIEGIVVGWFTECSAVSIERDVVPYQEGGLNVYVHQLPGRVKSADITLKRGIADGRLWSWFRKGLYDLKVERHNVSIVLFGADYTEAGRWDMTEAFPLSWTAPEFKADSDQVAVETLKIGQAGGGGAARIQRESLEGASLGSSTSDLDDQSALAQEIDPAALAEKVFALLKYELRWERERLGRNSFG